MSLRALPTSTRLTTKPNYAPSGRSSSKAESTGLGLKIRATRKITHFTKRVTTSKTGQVNKNKSLRSRRADPPTETHRRPARQWRVFPINHGRLSILSLTPQHHHSRLSLPPAASARCTSSRRRECSRAPSVSRIETTGTLCFLESPTVGKECGRIRGEGRKDWERERGGGSQRNEL